MDKFLSGYKPNGQRRSCTDLYCCLMLVAAWISMVSLGEHAVANGEVARLLNGVDYNGMICGVDPAVRDKPKWCCGAL